MSIQYGAFKSTEKEAHEIRSRTIRSGPKLSLRSATANAGMLLLHAFFRRIIHKGTLTLIGPNGQFQHIGQGAPSVAVRITGYRVIPRLLANPDLAFGEAYMDGTLVVERGDI